MNRFFILTAASLFLLFGCSRESVQATREPTAKSSLSTDADPTPVSNVSEAPATTSAALPSIRPPVHDEKIPDHAVATSKDDASSFDPAVSHETVDGSQNPAASQETDDDPQTPAASRESDDDSKTPEDSPTGETEYTDQQLHKNKTLFVLSFQPDIRADYLIQTIRAFIDETQAKQAKKIASSYNWRYEELLKKRAAILENATDEMDVKDKLRKIKIETVELGSEIRQRISKEILTREQRQKLAERFRDR